LGTVGHLDAHWVWSRAAQGDRLYAAEFFITVAVATTFFIELGTAHVEHIVPLIIGGVLAAPFGGYIARHMHPHALMAVVGALIGAVALYQLIKSLG
jgi:hypothetical protein